VAALPAMSFACSESVEPAEGPAFMNNVNGTVDGQSVTDKGTSPPPDDMLGELSKMTSKNWQEIRDRLAERIRNRKLLNIEKASN